MNTLLMSGMLARMPLYDNRIEVPTRTAFKHEAA
jgi:hypothetical protein